jgi:hypothetical protein
MLLELGGCIWKFSIPSGEIFASIFFTLMRIINSLREIFCRCPEVQVSWSWVQMAPQKDPAAGSGYGWLFTVKECYVRLDRGVLYSEVDTLSPGDIHICPADYRGGLDNVDCRSGTFDLRPYIPTVMIPLWAPKHCVLRATELWGLNYLKFRVRGSSLI